MDNATAYIIKQVLRSKWGPAPCPHPKLEHVNSALSLTIGSWFCMVCGRDVSVAEVRPDTPQPAPQPKQQDRQLQEDKT